VTESRTCLSDLLRSPFWVKDSFVFWLTKAKIDMFGISLISDVGILKNTCLDNDEFYQIYILVPKKQHRLKKDEFYLSFYFHKMTCLPK
jgi:hypothetical protein